MAANTAVQHSPPSDHAERLSLALADLWRQMTHDLFDSYRPERHYMRGPGPAWRRKHGSTPPAA